MKPTEALNSALFDTEQKLEIIGKSMELYGLPKAQFASSELDRHRITFPKEDCLKRFEDSQALFNGEQNEYFTKIKQRLDCADGGPLFLEGPAGITISHLNF